MILTLKPEEQRRNSKKKSKKAKKNHSILRTSISYFKSHDHSNVRFEENDEERVFNPKQMKQMLQLDSKTQMKLNKLIKK